MTRKANPPVRGAICREILRCQEDYREQSLAYKQRVLEAVASIYGPTLRLWENKKAQREFYGLPYFQAHERRPARSRRQMLMHALAMMIEAKTSTGRKRASKYAGALEKLALDSISPDMAAAVLKKNGGIEGVSRKRGRLAMPGGREDEIDASEKRALRGNKVVGLEILREFRFEGKRQKVVISGTCEATDKGVTLTIKAIHRRKPKVLPRSSGPRIVIGNRKIPERSA